MGKFRNASVALMGLLIFAAVSAAGPKKAKTPKPPTQEPIVRECVTVYDIYSHRLSILSGMGTYPPGLEAKIQNDCTVTVNVVLRIGYFNASDAQFGDGIVSATVASGARYDVFHEAMLFGLERGNLRTAKVIAVEAYGRR